jgi:hypothetical protein
MIERAAAPLPLPPPHAGAEGLLTGE